MGNLKAIMRTRLPTPSVNSLRQRLFDTHSASHGWFINKICP